MTLHQLRIFEAVAKHLSITKTAWDVRISQPAVSKQLKLLEEEFGVKFHCRTGRGIKLTPEGRRFRNAVKPILQQVEEVRRSINQGHEQKTETLVVGGTESPSASLLLEMLKSFRKTHPKVQPILRTASSQSIEQMILNSEVELGVITEPSYDSNIVTEPFRSEKVLAVVSIKHPLARKEKLSESELVKAPLIIKMGGTVAKQLEQMGMELNIVMQCESSEILRAAVKAGIGIGLLLRDLVKPDLKAGYLKTVEIPALKGISVKDFIDYPKAVRLSRHAEDFLGLLRRCGKSKL